jgi:alpha-L-fucosidase
VLYGEGPTKVASSAKDSDRQEFTPEDVRFTTHNGALYAIALGWPATGELRVRSLALGLPYLKTPVCGVTLLGSAEPISFHQERDGLHILLPKAPPDEPAFTFRILEQQGRSGHCGS